jgi:putative tryptophan/tyrosine transport system substrate-binding protein
VRRREFISWVGGAAAWPLAASAQQADGRVRRIGILARGIETDAYLQAQLAALREELTKLGWIEGRNARFDLRLYDDDPVRLHAHADELVRLAPDVLVAGSRPSAQALLQATRTIPIVFANVGDPVDGGLLTNIARPEGNATGATSLFTSIAGKWLELLKEAAPRTERVALLVVPGIVGENYFPAINAAAAVFGLTLVQASYRSAAELERVVDAFAAEPNGALMIVPPPPRGSNGELIKRLALKHQLPAIGSNRHDAAEGVMMSYGSDGVEPFRIAASYTNRILRGAKVSELVQRS